jgi:hypothetical protein
MKEDILVKHIDVFYGSVDGITRAKIMKLVVTKVV